MAIARRLPEPPPDALGTSFGSVFGVSVFGGSDFAGSVFFGCSILFWAIDNAVDGPYAAVFREHPFLEPKDRTGWLRRLARVTALLGFGIFLTFLSGHGQSAEIRLDTGDLRYCWFGVPFSSGAHRWRPTSVPK